MKIQTPGSISELFAKNTSSVQKNTLDKKTAAPRQDTVEIRFSGACAETRPTSYQLKLQTIKQQLESGTYQTDAEKLAQKLLTALGKDEE